jgi:hypothetical protein
MSTLVTVSAMKIPGASTAVAIGSLAEVKNEPLSSIIFSHNRIASLTGNVLANSAGSADKNSTSWSVPRKAALTLGRGSSRFKEVENLLLGL